MTVKIWFDPLSLKVLATKVVIRERMAYEDFLGGTVKDELDQLDKFAGRHLIKATGLYVRKGKHQISNHEWKSLKKRLPAFLIAFLSVSNTPTLIHSECNVCRIVSSMHPLQNIYNAKNFNDYPSTQH